MDVPEADTKPVVDEVCLLHVYSTICHIIFQIVF